MRKSRILVILIGVVFVIPSVAGAMPGGSTSAGRSDRTPSGLPDGFVPAVVKANAPHSYIVQIHAPSVSGLSTTHMSRDAAVARVLATQTAAVRLVDALGGQVERRFSLLVNGFAAKMTAEDASRVRAVPGVRRVTPDAIVEPSLTTSVPFIGAPLVWNRLHAKGSGVTVAVIDSGVDYTHKDFGGSGLVSKYQANDPTIIEPHTFPTAKVIGGWDFVGDLGYDPQDPSNDIPQPDPDPLDNVSHGGDHGTHVAGICCGVGVTGKVGAGVAPQAKILAYKVFDVAGTPSSIIIAAMERATDPNRDGNTRDHANVINFSLGSDFTMDPVMDAVVQSASDEGIVVVAAAGNAGNQANGGPAYVVGSPGNSPAAIGVAASIDQFSANTISASPAVTWPDTGTHVVQDWGGTLSTDLTGEVVDAREFAPPSDPDGTPAANDRALCDATPSGSPFAGKIVLVFKTYLSSGDCYADDKALHAQEAGAAGVILWDGGGGSLPSQWAPNTSYLSVAIPVVDVSGDDSAALAASVSPGAPGSYNSATVAVTLSATQSVIPGFADRMTAFTSEGPTSVTSTLKPDVSAPGFAITSASAGTGTSGITFDGTSMATPHIAGVAALLVQLHRNWTPLDIKSAIMNHATQEVSALDGSPVSAVVMGAGRVQAYPSAKTKILAEPPSLSFGLEAVPNVTSLMQTVSLRNLDSRRHTYRATPTVRYSDLPDGFASAMVRKDGGPFRSSWTFSLNAGQSAAIQLRLTLDPSVVSDSDQLDGWFYFNPNIDGDIQLQDTARGGESVHVPWHVSGLAASDTGVSRSSLDLTGGSASLHLTESGVGQSGADLYQLGTTSPELTGGHEDIAAVGARSFTGSSIDGVAELVPTGVDALAGIGWQDFLTNTDTPAEPIEFGVQTYGVRSTTDSEETDVLIDVGADGVFADSTLSADVLVVKLSGSGGQVCVFDLPSAFDSCDQSYYADYSNFNSDVTGVVIDASSIGLSDLNHTISYSITACDESFDPDSADGPVCDTVGAIDGATGTYDLVFDVTNPALSLSDISCEGFWSGAACDSGSPITVSVGSAAPGDDPSILALFPNNPSGSQGAVVTTQT